MVIHLDAKEVDLLLANLDQQIFWLEEERQDLVDEKFDQQENLFSTDIKIKLQQTNNRLFALRAVRSKLIEPTRVGQWEPLR